MNDTSEFLFKAYNRIEEELKSTNHFEESGTLLESSPAGHEQNLNNISVGDRLIFETIENKIKDLESQKEFYEEIEYEQEIKNTEKYLKNTEKELNELKQEKQIFKEYKNTAKVVTLKTTMIDDYSNTKLPEQFCLFNIKKVISICPF